MGSDVRDAEMVPVAGGELTALVQHSGERDFSGYAGVATVALLPDKATALVEAFPDEAYDILPTGEVYVSQVHYRRRLNEVFGPGSWALVPRSPFNMNGNTITREYALVGPGGRFISEAIGEAEYQPTNDRMTYASACEAAKSNALTRCCKDLGIASECWDKRFAERFKAEKCGSFFRATGGKPQWRRLDAPAFFNEGSRADTRSGGQEHAEQQRQGSQQQGGQQASGNGAGKPKCPKCGSAAKVIVGKYPDKQTKVQKPWYCLKDQFSWGDSEAKTTPADEPGRPEEDEEAEREAGAEG
jgi:hypothetical protein